MQPKYLLCAAKRGKSTHNEICDFYAHMVLTHEHRFVRCFCRYSGNITMQYFLDNEKEHEKIEDKGEKR